ncbi:MAG TPA: protein kinase [Polyangia bacterium]
MWETSGSRPTPGAAPASNSPKVMGRFRCEARIANEGPFETYRARVSGLSGFDQVFALTALIPGALSRRPNAAEALLRTARAAMRVKDARLANIQETGLAPGSAYVVAEFVHGINLRELVEHVHGPAAVGGAQRPDPALWVQIVAGIGAEMAGGLAAIHAAMPPVAHGGLCLTNVMVTGQGAVKLIDVGVYASVHAPSEIAQAPSRRGLVAPELSTAAAFTPAADMFALAAVLRRLLIGSDAEDLEAAGVTITSPLAVLLRSLMAEDPKLRPSALVAELALREIAKDPRGEAARDLTTLVRAIMRQRPTGEAAPADAASIDPLLEDTGSPFSDEPTAVVDVSNDPANKSASLAAILRELRGQERDDEAALFVDQAAARAAAAGVIEGEGMLPDSGATRLAPLPLVAAPVAPMPMNNTPLGGFSSEAPPAPDDAVMDVMPPPAPSASSSNEGEVTMVSTAVPSPADLAAAVGEDAVDAGAGDVYLPFNDDEEGDDAAPAIAAPIEAAAPMPPHADPMAAADAAVAAASAALEAPGASGVWERLAVGGSISNDSMGAVESFALGEKRDSDAPDPAQFPPGTFETSDFSGAHISVARLRAALNAPGNPLPAADAEDLASLAGQIAPQPNAPRHLLADLTSGEIAASLPKANDEKPALSPADVVSLPARHANEAAPEAIKFAEFSVALPMQSQIRREPKRETFTPPSWRPGGDLDGPTPPKEPPTQQVVYDFANRKMRRKRLLAVATGAVLSAAAVAALLLM